MCQVLSRHPIDSDGLGFCNHSIVFNEVKVERTPTLYFVVLVRDT